MKKEAIQKLLTNNSKWNWLIIFIISVLLITIVFFLGIKTNGEIQSIVNEQSSEQQLLLSQQVALGITGFLNEKTRVIEIVAVNIGNVSEDTIKFEFNNVYNKTSDIFAIQFINESGVVTIGYPEEDTPIGYDIYSFDRPGGSNDEEQILIDTFEWVRDTKQTNITGPIFLLEGEMASFILTPVYEGREFKGAVIAIIRISDISNSLFKNSDSNRVIHIVDNSGTILFDSSEEHHMGDNYMDHLNDDDLLRDIIQIQMTGMEGTSHYLDDAKDKKLIAYSPVKWVNQKWSVSVASPVSETDALIRSVYVRQGHLMLFSVGFILLVVFSFVLAVSNWNKSLNYEVTKKTADLKESNKLLQKANHELMKFDELKSNFLSMVSHELKTPLTAMRMSSEILDNDALPKSKRKEVCKLAIKNVDRLTHMVDDLLDISLIESGKLRFRKDNVDILGVINTALETVDKQLKDKDLNVSTEFPDDISEIEGDANKLIQAFVNLLSNASKFTHKGGHIWVKITESDKHIKVIVKDDGLGMSSDQLDNIFSHFYQIDNGPSRHYNGAGLGLAITKGIVEGLGGNIKVESILGKGSEFTVVLNKK